MNSYGKFYTQQYMQYDSFLRNRMNLYLSKDFHNYYFSVMSIVTFFFAEWNSVKNILFYN